MKKLHAVQQDKERLEEQVKKLETEAVKMKSDNEELQKVGQKLIEQKGKSDKRMAQGKPSGGGCRFSCPKGSHCAHRPQDR